MKLVDTRDGTTMQGELVATLPAGRPVSANDMWRFYRLRPEDRNYTVLSSAMPHDRAVLRRGDVEDGHYYIVPRYDFYKEEA